jgi:cyclopropane-fatty-acyl-phospholipid synthase
VTTTTLSRRQQQLTIDRVRAAGLEHRVTVLDRDYRELDGEYDKLVSVGMIEAVGPRLDEYFRCAARLLRLHGRMLPGASSSRDRSRTSRPAAWWTSSRNTFSGRRPARSA